MELRIWLIILVFLIIVALIDPIEATEYNCSSCSDCNSKISSASSGDIVRLNTSITAQNGYCIDFNDKDSITFDCNWNSILGDMSYEDEYGYGDGISLSNSDDGSNNNTIRNCNLSNFYFSIRTDYSSNNKISNIIVNSNIYGIFLGDGYNYNRIANITGIGNDFDLGINQNIGQRCTDQVSNFTGSSGYQLKYFNYSVNLEDQIFSALILCNADNSTLENITIISYNNGEAGNTGIYLSDTDESDFTNIDCSYTHGITLFDSSKNSFVNVTSDNQRYSGGTGFFLTSSSSNNIFRNISTSNNNNYGIWLRSNCINNTFTESKVNNNYRGIQVYNNYNNNFSDIVVNNNTIFGILSSSSYNNTFTEIDANNNGYGIYLFESYNNTLTNLTFKNNSYALYYYSSSDNILTDSTICYNNQSLYNDTSDNTFENNTFCVDRLYPFYDTWYSSLSDFRFNVSNPIFQTNCQLYVDSLAIRINQSVYNHQSSNISYTPSKGYHNWYVYCNDSYSNTANSSLYYFGLKKPDTSSCEENIECLGDYCVHCICRNSSTYCGDDYCDSGEKCNFCIQDCGHCTGGGGGGTTKPHPVKSHIWHKITPGSAEIMHINDPDLRVKQIQITVNNPVNNVKITVTKLDRKPASVTHEASGKVYKYIEIKKSNLDNEDIKKGKIEFSVTKTWVSGNNIEKDRVYLKRFKTDKWEKLVTRLTDQDDEYYYYESDVDGFSYFAIGGEEVISEEQKTTTTTFLTTTTTILTTTTIIPIQEKEDISIHILWILLIVIILAVVNWFLLPKWAKKDTNKN
jgi:PGF-pre-PGF domain-containing protein